VFRERVFDSESFEYWAVEEQEHDPEGEVVDRGDPEQNAIPPLATRGQSGLLSDPMVPE